MSRLLIILTCIITTLVFTACPNDDDDIDPNMLTGSECREDIHCPGVATCDDGFCKCPEWSLEIIPGFCTQSPGPTFASFDYYEGVMDTTIIDFSVEPTSQTWETGDFAVQVLTGRTYNRIYGLSSQWGGRDVGQMRYSGNPNRQVDSISLYNVLDSNGVTTIRSTGGWHCGKTIVGRFVDANTIEGNIWIGECFTTGDAPKPADIQRHQDASYPVTFRRIH